MRTALPRAVPTRPIGSATVTISWSLSTGDSWAIGAVSIKPLSTPTANYRSIGTDTGVLHSAGDASISASSSTVTFAAGANLPTNVGVGDELVIGSASVVAVDAVTPGSTTGTTMTISHTTSGADRLMVVGVSIRPRFGETVSSVTYNGVPFPAAILTETRGQTARVELWRLLAPDTGTHDVVITFSADLNKGAVAGVITFTGVDQTTPQDSRASGGKAHSGARRRWDSCAFASQLTASASAHQHQPGQAEQGEGAWGRDKVGD